MDTNAKSSPRVSIGLPVYNGKELIRRALESLRGQTYQDYELVISDNLSTDGTSKICQEYANNDSRIRYIRQSENIGAMPNFHFVLAEARGKYFMWAAHDDLWEPEFVEENVKPLDNNDDVICSISKAEFMRDNPNVTLGKNLGTHALMETTERRLFRYLIKCSANVRFYGLHRRTVLLKCVDEKRSFFCDDIVWMARSLMYGKHYEVERVLFRRSNSGASANLYRFSRKVNLGGFLSRNIPMWDFVVVMLSDPIFPRKSPRFWIGVLSYALQLWLLVYLQQIDIGLRAVWRWLRGIWSKST